jgi:hypothetical protein
MPEIELGSREWEVARNRAELQGFTPEIMLTPANQALQADFVTGMGKALFGPDSTAVTAEGTDTRDNFRLDHTKFLARVAFLHLDSSAAAPTERPFDLAVGVYAMHLDLGKIAGMSEEELKEMEYDSFDGVYVDLFDVLLENYVSKSLHHGSTNSRYRFQVYESDSGYGYVPGQTDDIVWSAYQVDTGYGSGTLGANRLGTHLEQLRVIVDVLQNGEPDQAALDNLTRASHEGNAITLLADGSEEAKKILPYLYGTFKDAVETPYLRDEIARHQYWHVQQPNYLVGQ